MRFYRTLLYQEAGLWPLNLSSPNRKQTDIVLCTMNSQRQDSWTSIKKRLCYSGHRVALMVHRAQKSVPDSAGEWPTFLPQPLESCSGTANVNGPNCKWESTSESYINFKADVGRYLLSRFIMPNVRQILFTIFDEWELQFMNSFIVSPTKLNSVTLSTTVLLITKQGISRVGITFWWLWKIMNFLSYQRSATICLQEANQIF